MRSVRARLLDILNACDVITVYIGRIDVDGEMAFDAIRARLIEISEAVKDLDEATFAQEPDIPWAEIARMRDHLARRYFDTTHAIVSATAQHDIPLLAAAVSRILREHGAGQ